MALADFIERFKNISSLLDVSTESVLRTTRQGLPCCVDTIQMVIHAVGHIQLDVYQAPELPEWHSASKGGKALAIANSVMEEHCKLVTSHSAFLQAAVSQLDSMCPSPSLSSTSKQVHLLYTAIFETMLLLQALPVSWPTGRYMLNNRQLYCSFDTLATHLCSMPPHTTRTVIAPGMESLWGDMQPSFLLLHSTIMCLQFVTEGADCDAIAALPAGLVNKLCCLACQHMGPHLSNESRISQMYDSETLAERMKWAEVCILLSNVAEYIKRAHNAGERDVRCQSLMGPAVLDAAKMMRLVFCSIEPYGEPSTKSTNILRQILFCCESHLPGIFGRFPADSSLGDLQKCVEDSHRETGGSYNCSTRVGDVIGEDQIPLVRITNIQLMSSLRNLMYISASSPSTLLEHTQSICHLAYSSTAGQRQAEPTEKRLPDALGTAHHCSFQVLIWMRQQKRKQQQHKKHQSERPDRSSLRQRNLEQASYNLKHKYGIQVLRPLLIHSSASWPFKDGTLVTNISSLGHRDTQLLGWEAMPGSIAVLEALLRQDSFAMTARQLSCAMEAVNKLLIQASPASLPACISLLSTVHKHTNMYAEKFAVQIILMDAGKEPEKDWGPTSGASFHSFHSHLVSALHRTLTCHECHRKMIGIEDSSIAANFLCPLLFSSTQSSASTCKDKMHSIYYLNPSINSSTRGPSSTQKSQESDHVRSQAMMERFRALIALNLSQLGSAFKKLCEDDIHADYQDKPEWLRSMSHLLAPDLKALINRLSDIDIRSEQPSTPQKSGKAFLWDGHAMTHFSGRMLAGCCNLDCRNLDGCSETALPTMLCGGCKKVRYCSVQCQTAAWRAGKHGTMCPSNSAKK